MTPDNSDKFTHRSPPRLHFPKLTKSAKPAAISTLTTLSFPKTYKCLEWTRTNPFSKTYKSWHCGEVEQVGGGYSNATSHGQPASAQHWGGQHFYPGSIIHLVLAYCWRSGLANQALLNLMSSTSHFASPLNSTQSKLQKTTHCGEGLSYNWLLPTNIASITWSKLKSVLD